MQGQSILSEFLFSYLMSMKAWGWALSIVAVAYIICIWKIAQEYQSKEDIRLMLGRLATIGACAGIICSLLYIVASMSDESRRLIFKMVLRSMMVIV